MEFLRKIFEYLKLGFANISQASGMGVRGDENRRKQKWIFKVYKELEEKVKIKRRECHLGELDHYGYKEQLCPTNISIKPVSFSENLTNGTQES